MDFSAKTIKTWAQTKFYASLNFVFFSSSAQVFFLWWSSDSVCRGDPARQKT